MFNRQTANKLAQQIFHTQEDNIFAISYRDDEAQLLAAFTHNNHFYGLGKITVEKQENLQSLRKEIEFNQKDFITHSTFFCIPHGTQMRFIKQFTPFTEVFKDPETNIFYSKLDTLFGNPDEMSKEISNRLIPYMQDGKQVFWEHFFNTEGGLSFLKSTMDSMEINEFETKLKKKLSEISTIIEKTVATLEKPVVLDLFGIDDISFSRSLSTKEEAFHLMQEIEVKGHEIVLEKMVSA